MKSLEHPTIRESAILVLAASCLLSCSKPDSESTADNSASSKQTAEQPASAEGSGLARPAKSGTARASERPTTQRTQRLKGTVRALDDLDVQRRKLVQVEQERRASLNQLLGFPRDAEIDISTNVIPTPGGREPSEAEQKEWDAYVLVALELQTIEAKEKLFNEQLERAQATPPE
jgi:hypothetical protein